jgi:hypothetical protein
MEITKTCITCYEDLPVSDFYKNSKTNDGYTTKCKKCIKDINHNYYQKTASNNIVSNVPRGGKREGAGRKSTGRSKHNYYVTPEEDIKIKEYIQQLRATVK